MNVPIWGLCKAGRAGGGFGREATKQKMRKHQKYLCLMEGVIKDMTTEERSENCCAN